MGTNLTLVPDDVVTVRYAGILSRPAMRELAAMRSRYPKSYDRERFFAEADAILDTCLDNAARAVAETPQDATCIVCDNAGGGYCEFCKA